MIWIRTSILAWRRNRRRNGSTTTTTTTARRRRTTTRNICRMKLRFTNRSTKTTTGVPVSLLRPVVVVVVVVPVPSRWSRLRRRRPVLLLFRLRSLQSPPTTGPGGEGASSRPPVYVVVALRAPPPKRQRRRHRHRVRRRVPRPPRHPPRRRPRSPLMRGFKCMCIDRRSKPGPARVGRRGLADEGSHVFCGGGGARPSERASERHAKTTRNERTRLVVRQSCVCSLISVPSFVVYNTMFRIKTRPSIQEFGD